MFNGQRSKRVIFVAHCILNQNAIAYSTAGYPATHCGVIRLLLDAQMGIVQMPCPELCCLGLDRGDPLGAECPVAVENTRIRRAIRQQPAALRIEELVCRVVHQIAECHRNGFL